MKRGIWILVSAAAMLAADNALIERGKAEEKRSCGGCHGVRIIRTQRLSRLNWERELDKMVGWGTVIRDRAAILEYLVATQGDDKPLPRPEVSGDGSK
jgi:mono/diheme cytochrome c family protein